MVISKSRFPSMASVASLAAACFLFASGCSRQTGPTKTFAAPESFRTSLAAVFDGYVIVANALADGQIVLAMNAASAMHAKLHEAVTDGLDSAAKAYWDSTTGKLMTVLHQPAAAVADLDTVRAVFAAYSPILDSAFHAFALETRVPIAAFTCAKALGGKGAMWMQRDAVPVNPYLGRADLGCAEPWSGSAVP
jgi:hypothetical protein